MLTNVLWVPTHTELLHNYLLHHVFGLTLVSLMCVVSWLSDDKCQLLLHVHVTLKMHG